MNILVLCTGNSARSILMESLLNARGARRLRAYSTGSQLSGRVHPHAVLLLSRHNLDTAKLRSESWDEFAKLDAPVMDLVITDCGAAARETCPIWPGAPIRAHWGVEDPAAAATTAWEPAFQTAFDILSRRTQAFMELPFETMQATDLRIAVTNIGAIS